MHKYSILINIFLAKGIEGAQVSGQKSIPFKYSSPELCSVDIGGDEWTSNGTRIA